MAHFAKLDENNIVVEVNVIDNQEVEKHKIRQGKISGGKQKEKSGNQKR